MTSKSAPAPTAGTCQPIKASYCLHGEAFVADTGCVPLSSAFCPFGDIYNSTTKNCETIPKCGDKQYYDVTKFACTNLGTTCAPGHYMPDGSPPRSGLPSGTSCSLLADDVKSGKKADCYDCLLGYGKPDPSKPDTFCCSSTDYTKCTVAIERATDPPAPAPPSQR